MFIIHKLKFHKLNIQRYFGLLYLFKVLSVQAQSFYTSDQIL